MRKLTTILPLALILLAAATSHMRAEEPLSGQQLDYLLRGASWKLEGICGRGGTPSHWKGSARFADDGGFEAPTECAHPWEPQWPRYKGAWRIEGDAVCLDDISANGNHNMWTDAFETGDCFTGSLDGQVLRLSERDGRVDWKFHYEKHPGAGDIQGLKANLPPAS